jgi:hypothetical protein
MVDLLGHFSRKHFVALTGSGERAERVGFGFRIFGLTFYRVVADLEGLDAVDWGSGQGSYFARKDIGDWDVALWVRRECLRGTRTGELGQIPVAVFLLGFCDPKEVVESFGRELVEFLRAAGVELRAEGNRDRGLR